MKKVLLVFVVGVVAIWVAVALVSKRAQSDTRREWPAGLGPTSSVAGRFPRSASNTSALELTRLADPVSIHLDRKGDNAPEHETIGKWVRTQLQRPDATVEEPPELVRAFIETHRDSLDSVRRHLLIAPQARWEIDINAGAAGPLPNLLAHMQLNRLFVASALERARTGDPAAWDDLHASWMVAQALDPRPEVISALIRLAIVRNVNVAARKMPLPVPEWFGEVRAFDARKAMLTAMQGEAWLIAESVERDAGGSAAGSNPLKRSYLRLSGASMLATLRQSSSHLYKVTDCGFDVAAYGRDRAASAPWWNPLEKMSTPNLLDAWSRVYRYEMERELTDRAFAFRGGITPATVSRCTDGNWIVSPDGVKFSRAIPSPGPATAALPLEFKR